MNTLLSLLFLTAPGAVPDVTAGPGLAEQARRVEVPIERVTVYSDRARVARKARLDLPAGLHTLRLPDLPGAVMMQTVRVECDGARVLRVETTPVERERFSIEQVEEHIERLEELTDRIADLDRRSQVFQTELAMLRGIAPRPPVAEAERVGKPAPPVLVDVWRRVLDFLSQRKEACRQALRKNAVDRRELAEELAKVQREVQRHNLGAFTDRKVQVVAILQAPAAGKVSLELAYFVPGASWKPAYNLHFDPERARVTLKTAGMVRQATGEDWDGVELALSTAVPGHGIQLPELLTWALGEKREFIPRPRAARMPRAAQRFAPPRPQPTVFEAERQARRTVLQQRLAQLQQMLHLSVDDKLGTLEGSEVAGYVGLGMTGTGRGAGGAAQRYAQRAETRRRPSRARMKAPPPPPRPSMAPRAPAPAPMEAEPVGDEAVLAESSVSRGPRAVSTPLGLFEPTYYQPPRFSDPTLPAVAAGGLDYVWACPTAISIPSSGESLRVPLAADNFPVETFYQATPSLKKTAYLKAKVTNRGERPILQGPVNIFVGKDFTGQGALQTVGPGGDLDFPLGADEDIRIAYQVVPATETEGVISKDEVTTYTVRIQIGNYKKRPVQIHVVDQVPKTRNEDIEIRKGRTEPRPDEGPDADGIMTWKLRIPAGKTRTIQFSYAIERPEDWQLTQ